MTALVLPGELTVEKARQLIASATDLSEIARIKNVASAIQTYARASRAARETIVDAQEIETRALRRAGELTLRLPKAKVRGSTSTPEKSTGKRRKVVEGPLKTEAVEAAGLDRNTVHLAEKLARLNPTDFELAIARAKEQGVARPRSVVSASKVHISNYTGNYEWGSPKPLIEDVRYVLGGVIDVDVASSEAFQQVVQAAVFYTAENSGLAVKRWVGNIYGNPPYAQPLVQDFAERLIEQLKAKDVKRACWTTNNGTETAWGQLLLEHSQAVCFPRRRIPFCDEEGKPHGQTMQGQMVNYFGDAEGEARFRERFTRNWGVVR